MAHHHHHQQQLFPETNDVLMGQSPNLRLHPGNIRLKELVAQKFDDYFDTPRTSKLDKTVISRNIIEEIQRKGRFLKQPEKKKIGLIQDAVWVLEDDPVRIRDKVASQFRGHLKEQRRRKSFDDSDEIDRGTTKVYNNFKEELIRRGREQQQQEQKETETRAPPPPLNEVVSNLPFKKRKFSFGDDNRPSPKQKLQDRREFRKIFEQKSKEFDHMAKQRSIENIERIQQSYNNMNYTIPQQLSREKYTTMEGFPAFVTSQIMTRTKEPPNNGEQQQAQADILNHLFTSFTRINAR